MSASTPPAGPNPYVGPRPFRLGEPIFGREREIVELDRLLAAERIVLLYSPSGAGKSSLVNAGLIKRLDWYYALTHQDDPSIQALPTAGRLDVWSPVRLCLAVPAGIEVANRFAWSVAVGFEQEVPEEHRRPHEVLARMPLRDCVAGRRRRSGAPAARLLIFDQFEEVLRLDPLGVAEKEAFFDQLGELLQDPLIWALFCLREDYLAALDPYRNRIPTHLSNRYRIDLLSTEAAADAAEGPTRTTPRHFAPGAAERLVKDLAQVQVQQPDGSFRPEDGRHVEPIHLQVVLVRLWDRMAPEDLSIDEADVATVGDVGEALKEFYESAVRSLAAGDMARERRIRDWFDQRLMTPDGVRRMVLQEKGESEGLPNAEIEALLDTYLVRAEPRGGRTWYELSHDRLIGPIREANRAWRETHLSDLQRTAALWDGEGRPDGLLLSGDRLTAALTWSRAHDPELLEAERDLLRKSLELEAAERRSRRQATWMKRLTAGATIAFLLAIAALGFAWHKQSETEAQKAAAEAARHVAEIQAERARRGLFNAQLARGREVLDYNPSAAHWWLIDPERFPEDLREKDPIWKSLDSVAPAPRRSADKDLHQAGSQGIFGIDLSADGNRLATVGGDGSILVWDTNSWEAPIARITGNENKSVRVNAVAFDRDSRVLAAVTTDGHLDLWDPDTDQLVHHEINETAEAGAQGRAAAAMIAAIPGGWVLASFEDRDLLLTDPQGKVRRRLDGHRAPLQAIGVSHDGQLLASGDSSGEVRLWNLETATAALTFQAQDAGIDAIAFSPDDTRLVTAGKDKTLMLFTAGDKQRSVTFAGHSGEPTALAFSPNGESLVSGDTEGDLILWDVASGKRHAFLRGHTKTLYGLAFLPNGTLVSASADDSLRLWPLEQRPIQSAALIGHAAPVYAVAFIEPEHGEQRLISASWDGTVRLWDPVAGAQIGRRPLGNDLGAAYCVAASPDGHRIAAGGLNGRIQIYTIDGAPPTELPSEHQGALTRLAFSHDGRTLASSGVDGKIALWDIATRELRFPPMQLQQWQHISSVAFSPPDDRLLASASWDGTVELRDPSDGRLLRALSPGAGRLEAIAFSPDGKTLAAASCPTIQTELGSSGSKQQPQIAVFKAAVPGKFSQVVEPSPPS